MRFTRPGEIKQLKNSRHSRQRTGRLFFICISQNCNDQQSSCKYNLQFFISTHNDHSSLVRCPYQARFYCFLPLKLILYTKLCAIKGHKEEAFSDLPRWESEDVLLHGNLDGTECEKPIEKIWWFGYNKEKIYLILIGRKKCWYFKI